MGKKGFIGLKILFGLLILIVIAAAAAHIFLAPLAKKVVSAKIGPLFEDRLQFDSIGISVPARSLVIKGITLQQPPGFGSGKLLTVRAINLQVALWPLLKKKVIFKGLTVLNPQVNLVQLPNGKTNAEYYFAKFAKKEKEKKPAVFRFHLDRLSLEGGYVGITSRKLSQREPALEISGLDVLLKDLNFPNDDKISSPFRVDAFVAAANPVSVSGRGKVTIGAGPLDFDAETEIKGIELADFTYLFPNTKVSVASGQANAKAVSQCRQNYVESNQHVEIKGLKLTSQGGFLGKTVLGMPSGAVVKFLEDKQGVMVFDFKVSGELNNLKANPKEIIAAAFSRSFREKFAGSILDIDQGIKQGVRNIGEGLKNIFPK